MTRLQDTHPNVLKQAVHPRNACCQEERPILDRIVGRPCDLTGADEEPEDKCESNERENDRNTATSLVSVKTCPHGSEL